MPVKHLPGTSNSAFYLGYRSPSKVADMKTLQQLSQQAIDDFRTIYEQEFHKVLSDDEVQEIAVRLLRFFGILSQPDPGKKKR